MIEMDAPLLKRRLNPFLLISTVVVLSLLAGLSVLYQSELNELVTDRKNLSSTLEEKNSRIDSLEGQIENLSGRSTELNESVENLRTDLADRITSLEQKNATIENLRETVAENNETIESLRQSNEMLNSTVNSMRLDFGTLCENDANNLTQSSEDKCEEYFEQ